MMAGTAAVTVIIVNWNGGELLAECLRWLSRQSLPPAKILVMDNASSDGSAERVEQMRLPGVIVRKLGANLGFAAANNRALDECDTDLVALLNPDAFAEPDWLENLVAAAEAHPDAAAFGSRQLAHEQPGILDGIGDVYHMTGLAWRNRHRREQTDADLEPCEIFAPCAAAALYRRAALAEAGDFDEDFFCYVEDVDIGFRLRLLGHRALYVPDAVIHHVGAATSGGQHSDFSTYHGHRNLVWCFVKDMPGLLFWALLPVHLLFNLFSVAFIALMRGQGKTMLRAKRDALRGIARMWHKRAAIQAKRKASLLDIWRVLDKRLKPSRH